MGTQAALAARLSSDSGRPAAAPRATGRFAAALVASLVAHGGVIGALRCAETPARPGERVAMEVQLLVARRDAGRRADGAAGPDDDGAPAPAVINAGAAHPGARPNRVGVARPAPARSPAARAARVPTTERSEPAVEAREERDEERDEDVASSKPQPLVASEARNARSARNPSSGGDLGESTGSGGANPGDGVAPSGVGRGEDAGQPGSCAREKCTGDRGRIVTGPELDAIRDRISRTVLYPPAARRSRLQGRVVVTFTIGRDGGVRDVRVAASSGHDALDRSAISAVRSAAPFRAGEEEASVTTPIVFRLE